MTHEEKKLGWHAIIAVVLVSAFVIFAIHHQDKRKQEQCERYPLICKPEVTNESK